MPRSTAKGPPRRRRAPSSGVAIRSLQLLRRLLTRAGDGEDGCESGDLEQLENLRLRLAQHDLAARRREPLGAHDQGPQADAAHVAEGAEIEDDLALAAIDAAVEHVGELGRGVGVEPPAQRESQNAAVRGRLKDFHQLLPIVLRMVRMLRPSRRWCSTVSISVRMM